MDGVYKNKKSRFLILIFFVMYRDPQVDLQTALALHTARKTNSAPKCNKPENLDADNASLSS
jgi:hypothetical protein